MPSSDASMLYERMAAIQRLFWRNPHQRLKTSEIARVLGVSDRMARNYLNEISGSGKLPLRRDGWHWQLVEGASFDILPVKLNLSEGLALYLAARLLARYSDERNPHVTSALAKLSEAMPQAIAAHIQQTIRTLAYKPPDPDFARIFETVAVSWARRLKVRISHQASDSANIHEYVLSPYVVEPSSAGYATYVIGYATFFNDLHTFKMERITRATLTDEPFEIPPEFDGAALFQNTWGVMYGPEIVEVQLRFLPSATRRVKESYWPTALPLADLPDGGCRLTLRVNHTLELKPWIRGWGPQVIVESPDALRAEMVEDAKRMVELYE